MCHYLLEITVDVMFNTLVWGTAFVVSVTRLSCLPARPDELKLTLISPSDSLKVYVSDDLIFWKTIPSPYTLVSAQ